MELFKLIIYTFITGMVAGIWGAWFYSRRF